MNLDSLPDVIDPALGAVSSAFFSAPLNEYSTTDCLLVIIVFLLFLNLLVPWIGRLLKW